MNERVSSRYDIQKVPTHLFFCTLNVIKASLFLITTSDKSQLFLKFIKMNSSEKLHDVICCCLFFFSFKINIRPFKFKNIQ